MTVTLSYAAITTVDKQLGTLIFRDLARPLDRFSLCIMNRGSPISFSRFYGPPILVRHNMLIPSLAHHITSVSWLYRHKNALKPIC
jgi:hypothetical protein